ncbi:MAG TPA: DUF3488 and transglutaminase-like domain-containing protein [Nitrospira sp.]|nr:DUF3488 and transglutaminase-like domain-containing protein [Nitrospira sp.]
MPFEQAFRVSALFLAASALTGLVLTGSVPMWLASVTGGLLVLSFVSAWGISIPWTPWSRIPTHLRVPDYLLIGTFLLFLLDLAAISRELLSAGIHFLVALMAIKLLTLTDRKDFRHLYAISLMAVLASAALTTEVWYIPIFVLYLLGAVWTLLLYHLTGDAAAPEAEVQAEARIANDSRPRLTSRFFWLTNGIALATFALALVMFFLLPRIGAGLLQKSRGEGLRTTGFSDRVDLGTIGSVKQDPQIVMRVQLTEGRSGPDRLYLRGLAYDRYNGRSWMTSHMRRRNLTTLGEGTYVTNSRAGDDSARLIYQDILLEPLDTAVLFAVPFPESITGDLPGLQSDGMAGLFLPFPTSSRIRYSVASRPASIVESEKLGVASDYPRAVAERYLQLPELSQRLASLVEQVTRQTSTPYEQVIAVHHHLLTSYRYSLDVDNASSLHPLEDFLFVRKTGYCEHYATAMVMMLRAVGIPARLVTGFLATEWNEFGGYFTVRQRDAHAWVEVFFPRSGWVTFDPTPTTEAASTVSFWDSVSHVNESLRLYWDRVFVHYSARDQVAVLQGIKESGDAVTERTARWLAALKATIAGVIPAIGVWVESSAEAGRGLLLMFAGVGSCLVVMIVAAKWRRSHGPQRRAHRHQVRIASFYRRMVKVLAAKGFNKPPSLTPSEFCRTVQKEWSEAGRMISVLTDLYHRGRFGGQALTADELSEAERLLRELSRAARH